MSLEEGAGAAPVYTAILRTSEATRREITGTTNRKISRTTKKKGKKKKETSRDMKIQQISGTMQRQIVDEDNSYDFCQSYLLEFEHTAT